MNFTCPEKHFDKNSMLTLWNNFRLRARKCLICGGKIAALLSNLLFCLQMGNWKNNFERIFTFSDFFRTSREHFLVFSLYHSRHVGPNWIPPARRNISIKKSFKRKLFVLYGLWAQIFKISLKYFTNGCQNYNLRVQRSTLRKLIFFWEFCKCVLRLWAIIVHTSGEKFLQRCPNCILRVKKNFSIFLQ